METQGIDARNQTTQPGKAKAAVASEVFGNLLTKLFDRLAAGPVAVAKGESELDAALFRSKAPAGDAVAKPEEPADDRELSARTRPEDDDVEDDHHDDAVVAAVEAAPRPAIEQVVKLAASAGAGTAQAEAGTAKPVDAATLADAEAATLALKPLSAPEAKGGPQQTDAAATGQGAGPAAATQNPIKVTVTEAPVRAQADHPLAPGAALALDAAEGDAVDLDAPAPTQTVTASVAGGHGANSQHNAAGGSSSQSNQGQQGTPFAAAATPAASAASPVATAVHASFAAQLEASSADLPGNEGAHQIFAAAPGATPGTANALRNTANTPAVPQLPRLSALDQIAVDIKKAIAAGKDQITINLKPAELGRIEVKLDVGEDGLVSAQVRADRPETLELLQRDARGLERALQDAGLRADSGMLSFGLRGDNRPDGQNAGGGRFGDAAAKTDQAAEQAATAAPAPSVARRADGRIDLHV